MAARKQAITSVYRGAVQEVYVADTGSEVIWLKDIKDGVINVTEDRNRVDYELVDGQTKIIRQGRKVNVEFTYDELVPEDINAISNADWMGFKGDENICLFVSGADMVDATTENFMTKITCEKSTTESEGIPYTVTGSSDLSSLV